MPHIIRMPSSTLLVVICEAAYQRLHVYIVAMSCVADNKVVMQCRICKKPWTAALGYQ